jgi:hypothetical protein
VPATREGGRSETSGATAATSTAATSTAAAAPATTTAAAAATDDDSPVVASAGADGDNDGQPPSGRPAKTLLAAAGIVGALLFAVPLLFIGGDDDDEPSTGPAAGVVLPKEVLLGTPTASYGTASPSASPSPTTTTSADAGGTGSAAPSVAPDRAAVGSPAGTAGTGSGNTNTGTDATPPQSTELTVKEVSTGTTMTTPSATPKASASPTATVQPVVNLANSKNIMLKNAVTGLCADLGGSGKGKIGAGVFQEYCFRGTVDNQMWDFETLYEGLGADGADVFQIRNVKDGLCMDLPGTGAVAMRTHVREGTCTETTADNQLWWLESRGNGQYWIHNKASNGMCLEVWGSKGSGGPDARLGVYPCSPTDDHEWIID